MKTIKTQNEDWGFYRTIQVNFDDVARNDQPLLFNKMAHGLIDHYRINATTAREFLDSRYGRHLADNLTMLGSAAEPATESLFGANNEAVRARRWVKECLRKEWGVK